MSVNTIIVAFTMAAVALRQANHADATGKLGLIAERDGACQVLAHSAGEASASIAGSHSNAN